MSTNQIDGTSSCYPSTEGNSGLASSRRDASAPTQQTVSANPTDIICGRGLHIGSHRGNLNLHLMVNAYREEYLKSTRSDKRKITNHVLDLIKGSGAKFIRRVVSDGQSGDWWEQVDDETAFKKVSHALRLRTKNASNSGPMEVKTAIHRKAGDSTDSLDQLKPIGARLPETKDSQSFICDSSSSCSRKKKSPCLSTGQPVSSTQPITECRIGTSSSALGSRNRQPAGELYYAAGRSPFAPSSSISNEQRLLYEAKYQAYWNVMFSFFLRPQR